MNTQEIIKNIEAEQLKSEVDVFHVGDTVRVHAMIKEGNRERIQVFEGTVIKRQGGSNRETFTVKMCIRDRDKGVLGLANELVEADEMYRDVLSYLLGRVIVVDTVDNGKMCIRDR